MVNMLSPSLHEAARQSSRSLAASHDPRAADDPRAQRAFDLKLYHRPIAGLVRRSRRNRDVLRCEVAPSVVVWAGARYPFMLEVGTGLVLETVDIQVERVTGERAWVSAS